MSDFIVSSYFREIARFLPVDFEVGGVSFELMPLTDELIEKLKEDYSSDEVVKLAADWSLSYDNIRVIDDGKMVSSVLNLWMDERMPEIEPTMQAQVGEKAIEISGLSEYVESLRDDEELAEMERAEELNNIDGDNLPGEDVTLGQLQADANAHSIHNNN